jgi:nicotinate-nucleotide pyrophosphorylase (carboxylating)
MVKVEVEVENEQQVLEAVQAKADVIMLDNRKPEEVKRLRALIPDDILVEVSGGITPETISGYNGSGADVISLGWLTHSVKALDISFNLE